MKNKVYFIVFIFFGVYQKVACQSLSQQQKDILIEKVQGFNAALKEYSGVKGIKDSTLYGKILEYKDGSDPQSPIANDLFNSQNTQTVNFINYLNSIEDTYQHLIDVEYDPLGPKVLDCIQTKHTDNGDFSFAYVSVKKTLFFQDKKREVTEIISVDLNNYQIPAIFFPDDSTYNKGLCYNQIVALNGTSQSNLIPLISQQVVPPVASKYKNAIKDADLLYNNGQYELAEIQYKTIITKFPKESTRNNLSSKVDSCTVAISKDADIRSYNKMMDFGNFYYKKGLFKKAGEFYGYALQYFPNDTDALTGLEKCKNMSNPQIVIAQIQNAEQLEAQTPYNYGEAFRILADVEPSGLLSTSDYYFMIENLYQRNPRVMTVMNFNDEDCENYLNIYRYKLRVAAEHERRTEVRKDVFDLLGDIVISNNNSHTYNRTIRYYPTWVIHSRTNTPINPFRSGYARVYRATPNTNKYINLRATNPIIGQYNKPVKHVFVETSKYSSNSQNPIKINSPNPPVKKSPFFNNVIQKINPSNTNPPSSNNQSTIQQPNPPIKKPSFFGKIINGLKNNAPPPSNKKPAPKTNTTPPKTVTKTAN